MQTTSPLPNMDPARPVPLKKRQIAATANSPSTEKPKRPLSAFNLFYRFKRQKVLTAISQGKATKEDITHLVDAAPGLEDHPPIVTSQKDRSPPDLSALRRNNIRKDLAHNLLPRDTRDRSHRTNESAMNGTMTFLELARLMNLSWKACDDFAKGVFKELSDESRAIYRERMRVWNSSSEAMRMKEAAKIAKIAAKITQAEAKAASSPAAHQQGGCKSDKNERADKAPSKTDEDVSDDGSAPNKTVGVRMNHLRQSEPHDYTRGADAQVTRTAVPVIGPRAEPNDHSSPQGVAPRAASNDRGPPQEIDQAPPNGDHQTALLLRVRELEGQLEAERLRGRVRELEGLLGRQRTVEDQLRAQVAAFSHAGRVRELEVGGVRELEVLLGRQRSVVDQLGSRLAAFPHVGGGPRGAAGGLTADPAPGGLSALVNASTIHQSLREAERADALSRIAAARRQRHASALRRPFSHVLRMGSSTEDATPNKRQRHE